MIYRFVNYIREECCEVKNPADMEVEVKEKKRLKLRNIADEFEESNLEKKQKYQKAENSEMNISELNFQDEEDQNEDHSVNADHLMKEFAYHFIPAKSEGLKKAENRVMGIRDNKKKLKQIVIEIDEDELLKDEKKERKSPEKERPISRQRRTGHLVIEEEGSDEIEEIELSESVSRNVSSEDNIKRKTRRQAENEVIWNNVEEEGENDEN